MVGFGGGSGGSGCGGESRSKEAVGMMALHDALRSVCLSSDWIHSVFWTIRPRPLLRGGNGCKVGDQPQDTTGHVPVHDGDLKWPNKLSFINALTERSDDAKLLFNPDGQERKNSHHENDAPNRNNNFQVDEGLW